jgi:TonB family protein
MKVCPVCGRDYVDELSYCLEDGTPLSEQKITEKKTEKFGEATFARSAQTVAASAPPAQPTSSNKVGIFVFVTLALLGVLILLGAGLAGIWVYLSRKNEVAHSNQTNVNRAVNGNTVNNAQNVSIGNGSSTAPTTSPTTNTTSGTPSPTAPNKTPGNKVENSNVPVPTPEKTRQVPKTISGGMLNGKAISLPKPPYPPAARAVRASGTVYVQVLIDENGNVVSATAVSGHPLLQAAAVAAARGARFTPTLLSGQPVKVSGTIAYNFVP